MSSETPKQAAGPPGPIDSDSGLVSQSCFDLLLMELVPMAQRLAEELHAKELKRSSKRHQRARESNEKPPKLDEDQLRESTYYRLESLGYRVGLGIAESFTAQSPLLSADKSNPAGPLDIIKFLCKDFWSAVFRKQIDNLKTNHRGVFVLTDNRFELLRRASLPSSSATGTPGPRGEEEARTRAAPFLFFPSGVVRGALSALGADAQVQADIAPAGLPSIVFQIKTTPNPTTTVSR